MVNLRTAASRCKLVVAGSTVPVAYDPADPQNSVLDRASKPPKVSFWTAFIAFAAVIVAMLAIVMMRLES